MKIVRPTVMKCGLFKLLNGVSSEIEEVGREQSAMPC